MGKFNPTQQKNFVLVPKKYTVLRNTIYLRNETYDAFLKMRKSALKDKIVLNIVSGTRNFDLQKNIWENKWSGVSLPEGINLKNSFPDGFSRFQKILKVSSVPGTSRHHWGTEIDINSVEPTYFNTIKGKPGYDWLTKNAEKFGFCQVYNSGRKTGYDEEKWHWTYLPISKDLTQQYKNLIKVEDIKGFLGDKYISKINLINDYILSINADCL